MQKTHRLSIFEIRESDATCTISANTVIGIMQLLSKLRPTTKRSRRRGVAAAIDAGSSLDLDVETAMHDLRRVHQQAPSFVSPAPHLDEKTETTWDAVLAEIAFGKSGPNYYSRNDSYVAFFASADGSRQFMLTT